MRRSSSRQFGFQLFVRELKKEPEGITVAGDSSWTDMFVLKQMFDKESLQQRTNQNGRCTHDETPVSAKSWNESPAAVSSSGVAVKYQ